MMQLFLRLNNTVTHEVAVGETVADARLVLASAEALPQSVGLPVLCYAGQPLTDEMQLSSLPDGVTLDGSVTLFGGKVHGSLARAGKVRGQTPKVEAQEKKKARTGRAKRRIQYNRRFVNVVSSGPGRRRGPNAQEPKA